MSHVSDHIKASRVRLNHAKGLDDLLQIRRDTPNDCLLAHEIDEKIEKDCQARLGTYQSRADLVHIYEAAPLGSATRHTIYRALVAFDEKTIASEKSLDAMKSYLDMKYLEPVLEDTLRVRIAATREPEPDHAGEFMKGLERIVKV